MFAPPTRAVAAALYRKVEEESEEFSSRLTTHAANNNMSLNRLENLYIVQLNIDISCHLTIQVIRKKSFLIGGIIFFPTILPEL